MPQVQLRSHYDFEGNRTWLSDNLGGGISYAWNNQRLQSMAMFTENNKSAQVGFSYDTMGRLSSLTRTANGDFATTINTSYTLDLLDRVTSITHSKVIGEDASTLSQFTYGYDASGEDPQWYLADRLGSVRQIVGASGAVLDEISYDSFGGILSESNPSQGDRFKFTGREYSPELGIYYYRARWYDPGSGRFISQDPIGFSAGDVNLYRYVGNAPGDATDPSGLVNWWNPFSWTTNELAAFSEGTQDGVLMIYNAATFHQDTQVNAYVNNIIQQNGGTYGFANGSAHVGAYAAYAGVFVWGWGAVGMPTFNVGFQFNGVIPHFIYGTTSNGVTTWAHASGIPGWLYIQVAGPTVVESSFTLMGVPILSAATALPAAYLTTNPDARTCLTAALDAWFHGTVGFRR